MTQPTPELYDQKAREMKLMAVTSADPGVREQLMLLAERYERLAAHVGTSLETDAAA